MSISAISLRNSTRVKSICIPRNPASSEADLYNYARTTQNLLNCSEKGSLRVLNQKNTQGTLGFAPRRDASGNPQDTCPTMKAPAVLPRAFQFPKRFKQLQLRLGRRRGSFLRLVGRQRFCQRYLAHDHAVAFFRVGVRHRHVWLERAPLHGAAFRVNEYCLLGIVILHRSGVRFRAEHDVVRSRNISRDRARAVKRTRACRALAHAGWTSGSCGCS